MTTPKFDRLAITQAVLSEDAYVDKNDNGNIGIEKQRTVKI